MHLFILIVIFSLLFSLFNFSININSDLFYLLIYSMFESWSSMFAISTYIGYSLHHIVYFFKLFVNYLIVSFPVDINSSRLKFLLTFTYRVVLNLFFCCNLVCCLYIPLFFMYCLKIAKIYMFVFPSFFYYLLQLKCVVLCGFFCIHFFHIVVYVLFWFLIFALLLYQIHSLLHITTTCAYTYFNFLYFVFYFLLLL